MQANNRAESRLVQEVNNSIKRILQGYGYDSGLIESIAEAKSWEILQELRERDPDTQSGVDSQTD